MKGQVMAKSSTEGVLQDVLAERQRQIESWGMTKGDCAQPSTPDTRRLGILTEEVGEVAELVNDDGIISDRPRAVVVKDLYEELIQVAAVAVAWCEGLTREAAFWVAQQTRNRKEVKGPPQ
jgi:NTP pyrophosphatase (non-canonical NTP hydrolase)